MVFTRPSQYILLLLILCVTLTGCSLFNRKEKTPRYLIPEMDTAREQYTLADRQYRDALGMFAPEARNTELRKSVQAFEMVVQRFPLDMRYTPVADLMIANVYREVGELAKAEPQYRRVLSRYSDDEAIRIDALIGLGQTLDDLRRPSEAKVHYKMVIDQYSSSQDPAIRRSVELARARYVQIREL